MEIVLFILFIAIIIAFVKNNISSKSNYIQNINNEIDDKIYHNLEEWENDLKTIWDDIPITVEFTYDSSEGPKRRKVDVYEVLKNSRDDIYIRGYCHFRKSQRTFNILDIISKIKIKNKYYDPEEWLCEELGLKPL